MKSIFASAMKVCKLAGIKNSRSPLLIDGFLMHATISEYDSIFASHSRYCITQPTWNIRMDKCVANEKGLL